MVRKRLAKDIGPVFLSKLTPATLLPHALGEHDPLAAACADLFRQAQAACALGSPFVRDVLVAAARQLPRAPLLSMRLAIWQGDRASAAMALRVNGDTDRAIADAFEAADATLAQFVDGPTQTNEVARSAALYAGLMVAAERFGHPLELLEIGSSAGLNLNLARYAYCLGGTSAGDPASTVRIAPRWHGRAPHRHPLRIASATGVDLTPLDVADPECCERLLAFVWADRDDRMVQLQAAIRLARLYPPRVERGDAADWLDAQLSRPQSAGITRAVIHSMVRQYLDAATRARIARSFAQAGARADERHPLVHLFYEWDEGRRKVELVLTTWPHGETRLLAHPDPYGDRVSWIG
jgi:hypothetical protein